MPHAPSGVAGAPYIRVARRACASNATIDWAAICNVEICSALNVRVTWSITLILPSANPSGVLIGAPAKKRT